MKESPLQILNRITKEVISGQNKADELSCMLMACEQGSLHHSRRICLPLADCVQAGQTKPHPLLQLIPHLTQQQAETTTEQLFSEMSLYIFAVENAYSALQFLKKH